MVCPRALSRLSAVIADLGPLADQVVPLYISVDPERDTPPVMKAFLTENYPAFTGLTGTREEVEAAKSAFRVFAQRRAEIDGTENYDVAPSASTYVLDMNGRFAAHFTDSVEGLEMAARLRGLLLNDEGHALHASSF